MPMCTTLQIYGKHVYKFHSFKSVWYFAHAEDFILTQNIGGCMKETKMPPAYAANLVANSDNTIYVV